MPVVTNNQAKQFAGGGGGTFAGGGASGRWGPSISNPSPATTQVPASLPQAERAQASGDLLQELENQASTTTATTATSQPVRASAIMNPDWRCKLRWPGASSNIFRFLPGSNTVIWPYTPKFNISYSASYEMVKTLQTNYATPTYSNSEISTISIGGLFTASTVYEANYLYAVIHFLKSSTKGYNFEGNAALVGRPPPILRLTYMGEGSIKDMPVVVQSFNLDYPAEVDYVKTDMLGASDSAIAIPAGMVPSEMDISVTVVPAYSRADLIGADYSTTRFINGDLIGKGFF